MSPLITLCFSLTFKAFCRLLRHCSTNQPVNIAYEVESWSTVPKWADHRPCGIRFHWEAE
ncbi:MAG: hypothetical protein ACFFDP_08795 [Promethearchaeota archaeon]